MIWDFSVLRISTSGFFTMEQLPFVGSVMIWSKRDSQQERFWRDPGDRNVLCWPEKRFPIKPFQLWFEEYRVWSLYFTYSYSAENHRYHQTHTIRNMMQEELSNEWPGQQTHLIYIPFIMCDYFGRAISNQPSMTWL